MSSFSPYTKAALRGLAVLVGVSLLVYLVMRAGPRMLLQNPATIGWGMLAVLALAGVAHLVKTWAWRLALRSEAKKVPFSRTLGLRLVSEAIGQFGVFGLVFGESTRVSLLGSGVTTATAISSVAMDRGLFIAMGAIVTIAGLLAAVSLVVLSSALRIYTSLFVLAVAVLVGITAVAIHKGWHLFSSPARGLRRIPWLRGWIEPRMPVIESSEREFLQFHREAPLAFWLSILLNLVTHLLAITEVYLIIHFLGARVSFLGALILESLTKLINVIGAVNPGNLGTYEGGTMAIGKLVALNGAQGLTLGLCRRFRAVFWAIIGGFCLAWYSNANRGTSINSNAEIVTGANVCN